MVTLSLTLLGSYTAELNGVSLLPMRTNKVQALLTYLVTERVFNPRNAPRRETLMALLWPGMPDSSARQNLRQAVYLLRQTVPEVSGPQEDVPFLLGDYHTVQLNPQAHYQLDLAAFVELVAAGDPEALAEAVALYRGDFLNDFYLDDSNDFEAWAAAWRGELRLQALDALEALAGHSLGRGEYEQAEAYARRQVALEPLREEGQRQLMEALARTGRRSAALAVYDELAALLQRELGVAPSIETQQLVTQIRAGIVLATPHGSGRARGYELQEEIGQGSFGTVYRAIQPTIGREVAVKAIRRRYANDPDFIRRFEAEAQLIARLEHPHIVPLYDYWREPGGAYLVMRWMRGGSLKEALTAGAWPLAKVVSLLEEVASALEMAHQRGVVHLDLKPANILLDEAGRAYLTDFGIAREWRPGRKTRNRTSGSPHYMAPEQLTGRELNPQSDLFSLGLVLYELLAGQRPYGQTPTGMVMVKRLSEPLPPLSALRPDLPIGVEAVIQQVTAQQPAERYPDATTLASAFRKAALGMDTVSPAVVRPRRETPNPYLGLRPFAEADADRFFGREALTQQLAARLRDSQFLVVVGPSGSGKSSVVNAGLLPALRSGALPGSEQWFITHMIPGAHPFEELEAALLRVAVNPPATLLDQLQGHKRGLVRAAKRLLPDREGTLLLVVDQFEELYTLVTDEEKRDRFRDLLQEAVQDPTGSVRVILTLRADFYDRPLSTQAFGTLVTENLVTVIPTTREELASAIRLPAEQAGTEVEEPLLTTLVADVHDRPGALPLLQYALTELFEHRRREKITLADYERIGRVRGALANRAEALYQELDATQKVVARQLFLRLVAVGEGAEDTRRRMLRSELETLPAGDGENTVNGEALATVIDRYGHYRLLTFDRDPATRGPTVEVAHEALLTAWPRLREWIENGRNDLHQQRRLRQRAQEWEESGRNSGLLLQGARLEQMAGWAAQTDLALSGSEAALLEASIAAREAQEAAEEARRRRELETARRLAEEEQARAEEQTVAAGRLRRRAIYLAGALVIAALLALTALLFGRQANLNEQAAQANEATAIAESVQRATAQAETAAESSIATSRELAAAAIANLETDPELSILLSIEALAAGKTLEAENALHRAIAASPVEMTLNHGGGVLDVAYSPDGSRLASAGVDGSVKIWDLDTGQELHHLAAHDDDVDVVAFSPDGARLLSASNDTTAKVWDAITGELLLTLAGHTAPVYGAAFSPDGNLVATGSVDSAVKIWDAFSGEELRLLQDETTEDADGIWYVAFNPDGSRLATASQITRIWNVATGELLWSRPVSTFGVNFNAEGTRLATESDSGALRVWDVADLAGENAAQPLLTTFGLNTSSGTSNVVFTPDGAGVLSLDNDGNTRMWDAMTGQELLRVVCRPGTANPIALSPDGLQIAVGGQTGAIKICNLRPGNELLSITIPEGTWMHYIAFAQDGAHLYLLGRDYKLREWGLDTIDGQVVAQEQMVVELDHDPAPISVDFEISPNRTWVAIATDEKRVWIWDMDAEDFLIAPPESAGEYEPKGGPPFVGISFSPDGGRLAVGGNDGVTRIFAVSTGEELLALTGHDGKVLTADFAPDGQYLATGGDDNMVRVWDAHTGQELKSIAYNNWVRTVKFSPDGKYLAWFGTDGNIYLWDLQLERDAAPREVFSFVGHANILSDITFSPDGQLLASASYDQQLKVWDVNSGQELLSLSGSGNLLEGVAFSPDGRYLATAGSEGIVQLYVVDLQELVALGQQRVTRWWTAEECRQYLHTDTCPPPPEKG